MLRRFSINFALLAIAIDACLVAATLIGTSLLRPALSVLPGIAAIVSPVPIPRLLLVVFPLAWVVIFGSFSLYDGKRYIRAVDEFAAVSLAGILVAVALAGVLYLSFRDFSRAQYVLFVAVTYLLMVGWRAAARVAFRLRRHNANSVDRQIVIVGSGPLARMVEDRIRARPEAEITLAGFVDEVPAEPVAMNLLGGMADLPNLIQQSGITDVVIALPPHFYEQIKAAVSCMSELPVRIWIALGFFDLALYRTVTEDLAGLPLLDLRASALDDYERGVKRGFDLIFGLGMLILASPLLIVAGLLILIFDGAPILFTQRRVGENGKLFTIIKFRTMVSGAEHMQAQTEARNSNGQLSHKTRRDPRITRLGRILRRFSIDELPQLINVIKGDMSLVGPRPELPNVVQEYQPWQRQRLAVPPGMTGWWQVTGRSDKLMHLHTEDDLYYVNHYSIWLDVQIIMRTIWVVFIGRGAF